MTPEERRIVEAAQAWLGTPYHHCGDVLGFGVDCGMLLVRVYCDLGLVPMLDPRPYAPDWHLHRSEERYLGWVEQYARKVDKPRPGDIPLFQFGRCISHGGIVESIEPEPIMIHANSRAACVERSEVRMFEDRFMGYWRIIS
jgi:cell wall-associated NlpC family hydrolase